MKSIQRRTFAIALGTSLALASTVAPAQAQSTDTPVLSDEGATANLSSNNANHGSYEEFIFTMGNIIFVGGLITAGIGLYNAGVSAGILPPVPLPGQ